VHRSGDRLGKRPPDYMGDVSHRHSYETSVEEGGVGEERMVGDLSVGAVLDDGISTEDDGARERLFTRSERVQALFPVRKKNNKVGSVWRSWVTNRRCRLMAAKRMRCGDQRKLVPVARKSSDWIMTAPLETFSTPLEGVRKLFLSLKRAGSALEGLPRTGQSDRPYEADETDLTEVTKLVTPCPACPA
jgi:hypothetical protein